MILDVRGVLVMEFISKPEEVENPQRVFKNNGKIFEEDIKASFGKHIWTYRPPDTGGGMMARFTSESICDLMAYNTKNKSFILMELKSTLGTSVSVRPYEQCMEYERVVKEFDEWNEKQTADSRRPIKEEIRQHRKDIRELYKKTNSAMIKYHQIKSLLEAKEDFGIETYLLFTFFKTANTYAITVESFVDNFWKKTTKKSINENDLTDLITKEQAFIIPQEYIRRTMRSAYKVDFLTEQ